MRCFLGLGSNLNGPATQLKKAVVALSACPGINIESLSSLYGSVPMGPSNQPDYVNAVVEIETTLSADILLETMLKLERNLGRNRQPGLAKVKNGPRTIDLDLLLYGGEVIDQRGLTVPHPGLHERDFVLFPLYEIAPHIEIPLLGAIGGLLSDCPDYGLICLGSMDLCTQGGRLHPSEQFSRAASALDGI